MYSDLVQQWMQSKHTLRYTGGLVPDIHHIIAKVRPPCPLGKIITFPQALYMGRKPPKLGRTASSLLLAVMGQSLLPLKGDLSLQHNHNRGSCCFVGKCDIAAAVVMSAGRWHLLQSTVEIGTSQAAAFVRGCTNGFHSGGSWGQLPRRAGVCT